MDDLYNSRLNQVEKMFEGDKMWGGGGRPNQRHEALTAENAVVDQVSCTNRNCFVTITYRNRGRNSQTVALIVDRSTRIIDQFGRSIRARALRQNMVVNARFSSRMTRSIPPQSQAFSIRVIKEDASSIIEEGRIIEVGRNGGFNFILTGNARNVYSQTRYTISRETKIRDRRGNPIRVNSLRPGQMVRIERASFQTASIPPQTNALTIQII